MQDPPNFNAIVALDVEHEVWIPRNGLEAEIGQIQLMGIAGRTDCRVRADSCEGLLQLVDEAQRHLLGGLGEIVFDDRVDIAVRQLTRTNGLSGHFRRARWRRSEKYVLSAGADNCDAAPSSSITRSCCRDWSLRISSLTYSLLVLYPRRETCSSTKSLRDSGWDTFIVLMKEA